MVLAQRVLLSTDVWPMPSLANKTARWLSGKGLAFRLKILIQGVLRLFTPRLPVHEECVVGVCQKDQHDFKSLGGIISDTWKYTTWYLGTTTDNSVILHTFTSNGGIIACS